MRNLNYKKKIGIKNMTKTLIIDQLYENLEKLI